MLSRQNRDYMAAAAYVSHVFVRSKMIPDFIVYFAGYLALCGAAVFALILCAALFRGWKRAGLKTKSSFAQLTMDGVVVLCIELRLLQSVTSFVTARLFSNALTAKASASASTPTPTPTPTSALAATANLQIAPRSPVRRRINANASLKPQTQTQTQTQPPQTQDHHVLQRILDAAVHDTDFAAYVKEPQPQPETEPETEPEAKPELEPEFQRPPMLRQQRWREFTHEEDDDVSP